MCRRAHCTRGNCCTGRSEGVSAVAEHEDKRGYSAATQCHCMSQLLQEVWDKQSQARQLCYTNATTPSAGSAEVETFLGVAALTKQWEELKNKQDRQASSIRDFLGDWAIAERRDPQRSVQRS
eukprot:3827522-Amphidinium_carterae.1